MTTYEIIDFEWLKSKGFKYDLRHIKYFKNNLNKVFLFLHYYFKNNINISELIDFYYDKDFVEEIKSNYIFDKYTEKYTAILDCNNCFDHTIQSNHTHCCCGKGITTAFYIKNHDLKIQLKIGCVCLREFTHESDEYIDAFLNYHQGKIKCIYCKKSTVKLNVRKYHKKCIEKLRRQYKKIKKEHSDIKKEIINDLKHKNGELLMGFGKYRNLTHEEVYNNYYGYVNFCMNTDPDNRYTKMSQFCDFVSMRQKVS